MECSEDGTADDLPPTSDLSPSPHMTPPTTSPPLDSDSPARPCPASQAEAPLQPSVDSSPAPPVVLTDDLREKIVRQVEYYFSDENLPTDEFLLKYAKKNKQGFVPVGLIASFRKMKKLVQDNSVVADALRTSDKLVVSADGKKVKRRVPLPDEDDVNARSVLVRNLSDNHSIDDIRRIFGTAGNIKNISISGNHQIGEGSEIVLGRVPINGKMEAIVEYETVDAAKSAVHSLNDKNDWRNGLRVELFKKMSKQGAAQRRQKNTSSEGHDNKRAPGAAYIEDKGKIVGNDGGITEPEVEHVLQEKNEEWTRRKYKGKGHGSVSGAIALNKPPPGPRMPDGTKGFTMGRGRPIVQNEVQRLSSTFDGYIEMPL